VKYGLPLSVCLQKKSQTEWIRFFFIHENETSLNLLTRVTATTQVEQIGLQGEEDIGNAQADRTCAHVQTEAKDLIGELSIHNHFK